MSCNPKKLFLQFIYSVPVSRSLKAHILLVLITLIWGSNFVVIKNALVDISPLFFNAVRMSLAAVVLAIIFYRELPRLTAGAVRSGMLVGMFLFIGNELQTVGLKYTPPRNPLSLPEFQSCWSRCCLPCSGNAASIA